MINSYGLDKLTFVVFVPLFESKTLTKTILNQASLVQRSTDIFFILSRFGMQ
jgi:hypothetical protein